MVFSYETNNVIDVADKVICTCMNKSTTIILHVIFFFYFCILFFRFHSPKVFMWVHGRLCTTNYWRLTRITNIANSYWPNAVYKSRISHNQTKNEKHMRTRKSWNNFVVNMGGDLISSNIDRILLKQNDIGSLVSSSTTDN